MPTAAPGLSAGRDGPPGTENVSDAVFEDRTKAGWWMKTVQLDLEARGLMVREPAKPTRWHYDATATETTPVSTEKRTAVKREARELPALIRDALTASDLLEAYERRPFYQRNDYIGWIMDAKRDETRTKRIEQLLEELRDGDRYMNMAYSGSNG
jgi:hypothetical protein